MTFPRQRGLTGRAGDTAADAVCRPWRLPTIHAQCRDCAETVASDLGLTPRLFRRWARARVAELTAAYHPCSDESYPREPCADRVGMRGPLPVGQPRRRPELPNAVDWRHALAIGWFGSASNLTSTAYRLPDDADPLVPRARDTDAPPELPGVDLEAVREVAAHTGSASPLREHTRTVTARASLVRKLAGILSGRHCATVHALYDHASDRWSLAWEHPEQAKLTHDLLAEAAASDSELAPLLVGRDRLRLGDRRLDLVVWARRMALLDELVRPDKPITATGRIASDPSDRARRARPWSDALPGLHRITRARALLTYNRSYECDLVTDHIEAVGTRPGHLSQPSMWSCLLEAGSAWWWHMRHRADGRDRVLHAIRAARDLLRTITGFRGSANSRAARRAFDGCEHAAPSRRRRDD